MLMKCLRDLTIFDTINYTTELRKKEKKTPQKQVSQIKPESENTDL